MKSFKWIEKIVVIAALALSGCATTAPVAMEPSTILPEGLQQEPAINSFYPSLPPSEGSLWTDSGSMFFVDSKARSVGDTVTVDIVENASSSLDVNTDATRTTGLSVDVPNMLGYMRKLEEGSKYLRQGGNSKLFSADFESTVDAEATSDRSGRITASIGARVVEVLPNGNISIYGKREMKVNNEVQIITVSGVLRPQDIGSDNRVKSTTLADARIEFYGQGVLAAKQKQGWLTKALDNTWPF